MLRLPFEVVHCSWPSYIRQGEPTEAVWTAPHMPHSPLASLEVLDDQWYWTIHWEDFFRSDFPSPSLMRGFHVVFQVKMHADGVLFVKSKGGCIIKNNNNTLYSNPDGKEIFQLEIPVKEDEYLDIALYHTADIWMWSAYLLSTGISDFATPPDPVELLTPYLEQVEAALRSPNGPPLKVYTNAYGPIRTIVGLYSLILNGYIPSAIYLFGDSQWSDRKLKLMQRLLPFVSNVPTSDVLAHLRSIGGDQFATIANGSWPVMKTAVALLYPPHEFCLIDDDILVLDRLDDALEAFKSANFVYTANHAHEKEYTETWKSVFKDPPSPLPTADLNAGFYWLRNRKDPVELAKQMIQVPPILKPWWDQGFMALAYLDESSVVLSPQRYYIPIVDGLPGGILGYDYTQNPCRFACLHFAGRTKPSDGVLLHLLPQILHTQRYLQSVHLG